MHRSTDKADIDLHKTPAETLTETKFSLGRHVRLCNHALCYCLFRHPTQITIHSARVSVRIVCYERRSPASTVLCCTSGLCFHGEYGLLSGSRIIQSPVFFGALCSIMHIPLNLSGLEKSTSPRKKCASERVPYSVTLPATLRPRRIGRLGGLLCGCIYNET